MAWPLDPGSLLTRQLEYNRVLDTFLAKGVNPRLSNTWGYWTTDSRGFTVHAFVIGAGWIGIAAFPSNFEVQLDVSELDPNVIDCLYLYRYDASKSKYQPNRSTDEHGIAQTWQLKQQLMREFKDYRKRLLAGQP